MEGKASSYRRVLLMYTYPEMNFFFFFTIRTAHVSLTILSTVLKAARVLATLSLIATDDHKQARAATPRSPPGRQEKYFFVLVFS